MGAEEGIFIAVVILLVEGTTDLDRDYHIPQAEGLVVKDDIVFIFLSMNPNAVFINSKPDSSSDDKKGPTAELVTPTAGSLVNFQGSIESIFGSG